jgi:hypothetical protein
MTMTIDERLEELREELRRQDQELAAAMTALSEIPGDATLVVADEALRELEVACAPPERRTTTPMVVGIRA